jgi:hypothetical protein
MNQPARLLTLVLMACFGLAACGPTDPNDIFIQGTWTAAGDLGDGQHSWYLEWTFKNGAFNVAGYPPLQQTGRYHIQASQGQHLTLLLTDQKGDWPTGDKTIEVQIDSVHNFLIIDNLGPFNRRDPPATP